jgi:serine/threonine-protein kinase HipA
VKSTQFTTVSTLKVTLEVGDTPRPVGRLAWGTAQRRAFFEYDPDFIVDPLPISPFNLPVKPEVHAAPREPFQGLHGVFNDSLPDGWGRKLLDRSLARRSLDFTALTPLDRLAFVGSGGMGALCYAPEFDGDEKDRGSHDLDWFAEQSELVMADVSTSEIDVLRGAQGGSGGARPKINVGIGPDDSIRPDYGEEMPPAYTRWIVKFRGAEDGNEIGTEEYAYAVMADAAGISMPETRLIETLSGGRYFAARRFDRTPLGRVHVQTASALVNADHRSPSLDYITLHKIVLVLTRDQREVSEMFRRMTFNVFARNRDDHAKNHAFRMDEQGSWTLTPAYDLTFSPGAGGEHNLDIAGEGRNPRERDILRVAETMSIEESVARSIIDEVREAIDRWPEFADVAKVPRSRATEIGRALGVQGTPKPRRGP